MTLAFPVIEAHYAVSACLVAIVVGMAIGAALASMGNK